jgi:hypothetical protein
VPRVEAPNNILVFYLFIYIYLFIYDIILSANTTSKLFFLSLAARWSLSPATAD